jgi:hypothetical protein
MAPVKSSRLLLEAGCFLLMACLGRAFLKPRDEVADSRCDCEGQDAGCEEQR